MTLAFAEAVGAAADRTLGEPEPWRPGAVQDDRCDELSRALAGMGWLDLASDPRLLPLAGPAALELGRRLAPLSELDALLGGSPLAGDLVRYGATSAVAFADDAHGGDASGGPARAHGAPVVYAIDRAEPVAYGDALGVHRVLERHAVGRAGDHAIAAWIAASTGYLAGLSEWALGIALDYAKGRKAFGGTLASLAPVQQRLADAATAARGLSLLAADTPGRAALAHAGAAAVDVTAACQQVAGAIGFTLEFPLQRAYRRARAVQLWADALIAPSR
ncbi:MAG TPA: acyl-CoA dehydrogenase family protein [Solirubrobacteraceae bacterium]|nr:acyl-CoA dehydrogenase family protein [Solirubrobacteraceae bacterium]